MIPKSSCFEVSKKLPIPDEEKKFKASIKPFEAPQRRAKIKI